MSEKVENLYDEDGEFKDDIYDLDTFSHSTEAKKLVLGKLLNKE